MIYSVKFQHCDNEQIQMILDWRNSKSIRDNMVCSNIITKAEHFNFVRSLKNRPNFDYRLVFDDINYYGVVNLSIIKSDIAELGIYKNPNLSKNGIGIILMDSIYKMCKEHFISKLILKVKKNNIKAETLYLKQHFTLVDQDGEYKYMEKTLKNNIFIIAELSANHGHDIEIAKKTITAASESGADAVKIQTYTADTITINCDNDYFKINNNTIWDGRTLYDLYSEAYTPWEWYGDLKKHAEKLGLIFFSTPFDKSAVDFLESYESSIYKVASFEITDIPLIKYIASKKKPIIISTGIAKISEIQDAVDICKSVGNSNITLLKCTSSYPAPIKEANLRTMVNMKETFSVKVGLSDHTIGADVSIAAVALGAKVIEKHFILDKNIGGPDAPFSMEPDEFYKMVKSIRNVENAIGKVDYSISRNKEKNRKFCRSLFIVSDIKAGEEFNEKNIRSIRPSDGLPPKYLPDIIGRMATRDLQRGTPLKWEYIQ